MADTQTEKKEELDLLLHDVLKNFSTQSDKQDTDTQIMTRDYLDALLRAHLKEASGAYKSGERLSYEEFKQSSAAASSREEIDRTVRDAQGEYYDSRARALRSKNGRGSGYGAYAAAERKSAYERVLREAATALAESYDEFYEELETGKSGADFEERFSVISYIASNRMNEREALIYALGAGLSYEEAEELAGSAHLLGELLDDRFEEYGRDLYGEKIQN